MTVDFVIIIFIEAICELTVLPYVQVNSQLISNVCTDALSAEKVMGSSDIIRYLLLELVIQSLLGSENNNVA